MHTTVLVKQIPDINKIQFDPSTGRIIRDNVPLQMNSFDRKAVDEAIKIKEKLGGTVSVVTMGPPFASEVLNLSLRMGADRGILISDRAFAGADTLVTSIILAEAVKKLAPDLVLAGKYSLDGETSQVPPEVAYFAGYNFKSSVSRIDFSSDQKTILIEHEREDGLQEIELPLKALVSVSEKINRARPLKPGVPDMTDRIENWTSADLGLTISGQKDSPTVVSGTARLESGRNVHLFEKLESALETLVSLASESGNEDPVVYREISSYDASRKVVLGVCIDDPSLAIEISSKIFDLSRGEFNIELIGNVPPDLIRGAQCHVYHRLDCGSTRCMAADIFRYIEEKQPEFVVFPSTVEGREVSAMVAAMGKLGLTADCVDLALVNGILVQMKPAFGGGVVANITSKTKPAMATVRPGMFKVCRTNTPFRIGDFKCSRSHTEKITRFIGVPESFRPLRNASIIVGIGKGIGDRANVEPIRSVADSIGAALGATRPLVDLGFVPRQVQIGLTGISISPSLYLALGISGHDNHVVGFRYAKKIFSVNKDPNAPIFKYSDYGYVGDCMEFVKSLSDLLNTKRNT